MGGGASFLFFEKKVMKNCRVGVSSTGARVLESCCYSPGSFIQLMQRYPRDCDARYSLLTRQRLVDLIHTPNLLVHAVAMLDTGSATF